MGGPTGVGAARLTASQARVMCSRVVPMFPIAGCSVYFPRGEIKHGRNLLARQMEPLHDFVDSGSGFQVFKHDGQRHSCVLKHPGAADLAGDTVNGGAL